MNDTMRLAVKEFLGLMQAAAARSNRLATLDLVAGFYGVSAVDLGREINRLRRSGLFPELAQ